MKMTYSDALKTAINALSNDNAYDEAVEKLSTLLHSLEVRNSARKTPEAKEKVNAQRKAKTAEKRVAITEVVAPVVRKYLTVEMNVKQLFDIARSELPEDFTANKLQYVLLHDMTNEVEKVEAKGKANVYRLIG